MIKIDQKAWQAMVAHAEATFPNECCGAMIGAIDGDVKQVTLAEVIARRAL
jgi:proteasome lid subunit RPN8/RPN11